MDNSVKHMLCPCIFIVAKGDGLCIMSIGGINSLCYILLYNIHMYFVAPEALYPICTHIHCTFLLYLCIVISLFYEFPCVTGNCLTHALHFSINYLLHLLIVLLYYVIT